MIVDEAGYLEHHGVKGQKWGVRRAANKMERADAKWQANVNTAKTFVAVHNRAAEAANKYDVPRINNKPEYKHVNITKNPNSALTVKYLREHEDAFNKRRQEASDAIIGPSPSGTIKVRINHDGTAEFVRAKHSGMDSEPEIKIVWENGLLKEWALLPAVVAQSATDAFETFISHHGIKGMKWGIRRRKRTVAEDAARAKTFAKTAKKEGTSALSNKDLQTLVTRMNLEQQYSNLNNKNKSSHFADAHKFVKGVIGVGKTANEAIKFANSPMGQAMGSAFSAAGGRASSGFGGRGNSGFNAGRRRYSQALGALNP